MSNQIELYESLLNQKAQVEKEGEYFYIAYMKEFGDEIADVFELKVESIALKKKIAYCVKRDYEDKEIYQDELDNFIDAELVEYQNELNSLLYEKEVAKNAFTDGKLTFIDHKKLKKIYYEIAHLIHPDLHPEFVGNKEIEELWLCALGAYKCNDLESLTLTYDKILIVLATLESKEPNIDDIEKKIEALREKIEEMKKEEPYIYKFVMDDEEEIAARHEENKEAIKSYQEYIENLKEELSKFKIISRGQA